MPVDPRMFAPFDAGEIMERAQRYKMNNMRVEEYRTEQGRRKRLGDLLPGAVKGDRESIDALAGLDPDMFMKLDDRQRAHAQDEVKDLTAAVRWADSPEKWSYVQQHYGQKGIDLSPYGFEERERGMLMLGKIGEYLESAPKPEIRATEPGGGLYSIQGDQVKVLVQPNDGSAPMGAPAQGGGLAPGKVVNGYRYRGGNPNDQSSWEPVNGGPTPSASGGFPSSGY